MLRCISARFLGFSVDSNVGRVVRPVVGGGPAGYGFVGHEQGMLGYAQHAERRCGLSDYEEALVVEGELEPVEELAVHDSEKDCVAWRGFAGAVRAIAKDNAKGVGFLMPSTASVHFF